MSPELETIGDGLLNKEEGLKDMEYTVNTKCLEDYFESYQDFDVHRLMLEDTVRTNAYRDAIYNGSSLFDGKIVMDIGAGTGILSLFCAKAGAKKVYAVEASGLAKTLPAVVDKNGFNNIIEIIHSKVEDVKLDLKVDIIVSEWMGFYLLHESMLDSVIVARDKFLKPDGLMFPKSAQIYASPCKVPEIWKNYHNFWTEKQYDFDLSPFADMAKIKDKPEIACVEVDCLLSDPQLLWDLDLMKIDTEDIKCLKDRRFFSIEEDGEMQAICVWFNCCFPVCPNTDKDEVALSTAPWDPQTHWKQTIVLLPDEITCEAGDIIGWEIMIEKASLEPFSRSYRIHLQCLDADTEEHPVPCLCGCVKCELVRHFMNNHPSNNPTDS